MYNRKKELYLPHLHSSKLLLFMSNAIVNSDWSQDCETKSCSGGNEHNTRPLNNHHLYGQCLYQHDMYVLPESGKKPRGHVMKGRSQQYWHVGAAGQRHSWIPLTLKQCLPTVAAIDGVGHRTLLVTFLQISPSAVLGLPIIKCFTQSYGIMHVPKLSLGVTWLFHLYTKSACKINR
jgi:hypothetical protein